MNKELEKIYLDQIGYEDYLKRLSVLEETLKQFNAKKSTEAKDFLLEEHYLSATSSDLIRREKAILEELQDLRKRRRQIEIIEKHGDDAKVDIGDKLLIEIMYAPDDIEEIEIEVTATMGSLPNAENKVSINSPLGKALFTKTIGGIYTYQVGERKMSVHIKQKLLIEDKLVERK